MTTGYIKYITDEEFKQILQYVREIESPSLRLLIFTLMLIGIRIGETVTLKRSNFNNDFTKVRFKLLKRKPLKIKERSLPNNLARVYRIYYDKYNSFMREDYMFFPFRNKSKNEHIQESTVRHLFKIMRKELNIDEIYYICKNEKPLYRLSPHTLRHYVCYKLYKSADNDLIAVNQIIDHKKIETTAKYVMGIASILEERKLINSAFKLL